MTLKEFRETVAESEHKEWLNELSISIKYDHLKEPVQKEGITDIYRFFRTQHKEWNKLPDDLPVQLSEVREYYIDCVSRIENYIEITQNKEMGELSREWNKLHNVLNKTKIHNNNYKILTADIPEIFFLVDVYQDYPHSFTGAYDYLICKRVNNANLNNSEESSAGYLRGVNLAYEFQLQDHTDLLQRRNNEKKSLGQLRSNFEEYLSEAESSVAEYLIKTKNNFDEHSNQIVELQEKKEKTFDSWFDETKKSFNTFDTESHDKIKELENLYTEKLRLDAPVQYWGKRALWMNIFSGLSVAGLVGVVGASAYILYSLLTEDLDIYNLDEFLGDPGALKWSIIYITLFSFLAYLVRTLAKISFSFLHLARDAEERKQLTHVYLALSEESDMSKEDREIVLQSIFSRADTGLLKGDSSPTMPGIILEKLNGK